MLQVLDYIADGDVRFQIPGIGYMLSILCSV